MVGQGNVAPVPEFPEFPPVTLDLIALRLWR
jgi:hypothetical protein